LDRSLGGSRAGLDAVGKRKILHYGNRIAVVKEEEFFLKFDVGKFCSKFVNAFQFGLQSGINNGQFT
jgi:hypothetical protein